MLTVLLAALDSESTQSTENQMMQNYHFGMAKAIIGDSDPGSDVTEAEGGKLAKAQVHATLAVADAISAVAEAIVRTRQQ